MARNESVQPPTELSQERSPPAGSGANSPTLAPRNKRERRPGAVVGISCALSISVAVFALIWLSVRLVPMRRNDTGLWDTPFCCPREAAKLFAVIDHRAPPCEDFFAYVCRNAIDQKFTLENEANDILWNIRAHIITATSNYSVKAATALQAFYTSCVTEVWQPDLRLRDTLAAVLEIANTTKRMSHAQLLRFALEVQIRYKLIFYFTVSNAKGDIYFKRKLLRIAAYRYLCDDACYATILSVVNAHFGAHFAKKQITAWEQLFIDHTTPWGEMGWDEISAAFGGMEAEQFKAILLEFHIDTDTTDFAIVYSKADLFADIARIWNVVNQPLSLCHAMIMVALSALEWLVLGDAKLNSPTLDSGELCQLHLRGNLQLWRTTYVAALTSPDKDRQLRAIFEGTRQSFVGYQPLRQLVATGNDTAIFENLMRSMTLMLPGDLLLPEVDVPVFNNRGFVRNIFRMVSFEYDTRVEKQRRRMPVLPEASLEFAAERMLFVNPTTLYVNAPAYAWLSVGTANPLLADAPVIASRMAYFIWSNLLKWSGWSARTRRALQSFRECIKKSEMLSVYHSKRDLFSLTMGLRIAASVAAASYATGHLAKTEWFRLKLAWSLYRMSDAQFFYARYAYFRCAGDDRGGSVNGPTNHSVDFSIAFQCQQMNNNANESGCADLAATRGTF
ncbi:hypothetical protein HPB49_020313 [Dermacentor silvarum]|uniref:Uncharacterized protein n=1 Tax=Dermacentor silvarum TaxID=543639 RepID=A0ACB8C5C0_DERSI|nr:hypothetical protein HPB49_020313 [Dermacentor silvarum]